MTLVKQYCMSRYGGIPDDTLDDDQLLINAMNQENSMELPLWENRSFEVALRRVPLRLIRARLHYSPDAREPIGEPFPIHGVLLESSACAYCMVDGYHRLKWLKEHGAIEGVFLVLSEKNT